MNITALKGFKDILPDETPLWQRIEATARGLFQRYGYAEVKVPILEKTSLFLRSIGETTDIVEKEMYTFTDRNGEQVTLRPEGTASVLRAFIEHSLHASRPVQKLFTIGPMFRHERPQKGRLRQFHQMSLEVVGASEPLLDAEVLALAWHLLAALDLSVSLEINSLGCPACRPGFNEALSTFLAGHAGRICEDCERRRHRNPLRTLDCKNETCHGLYQDAPSILAHLCADCASHFQIVQDGLSLVGIPHRVNPFMVRGLDYYSRTTFELVTNDLGAQSAVGAGGRYDGLVKQLGGPAMPGIGFAMGMERLVLLMQQKQAKAAPLAPGLFIAALGAAAQREAFRLVHALRQKGVCAAMDHGGKSLKSQMKQADRLQLSHVLILGDDELARGEATMKAMATSQQEPVRLPGDLDAWCGEMARRLP